jgi:hypothetical protein
MSKVQEKKKAHELRRQGWSIKDIAALLSVSKGSVSVWCQEIFLTTKQQENLRHKQLVAGHAGRLKGAAMNKQKRLDAIQATQVTATEIIGSVSKRDLLLLGIGLYWGEGLKARSGGASLINSDPDLLVLGKQWFEQCLGVNPADFRPYVYISESHKQRSSEIITYWSTLLDIPKAHFKGPFYTSVTNKKQYKNHDTHFGVLALRVQKGTHLKYRIQGLISTCKR